ncbi:YGR125W [Symbiodinium pilosum]|uniref:YGR125W protein n=1 Tax=Symbiodinium pilosum TaxID=2952 RepID=A0A812LFJ3_SYMPI|nr:YGR125W [Symbiodinium pilosum]
MGARAASNFRQRFRVHFRQSRLAAGGPTRSVKLRCSSNTGAGIHLQAILRAKPFKRRVLLFVIGDLLQKKAAPAGPVVAVLAGHTHEDASAFLQPAESCEPWGRSWTVRSEGGREKAQEGVGALQYTTHTAAEGAYRILTIY